MKRYNIVTSNINLKETTKITASVTIPIHGGSISCNYDYVTIYVISFKITNGYR